MADDDRLSSRAAKKFAHINSIIIKQEIRARMKQVRQISGYRRSQTSRQMRTVLSQKNDKEVAGISRSVQTSTGL